MLKNIKNPMSQEVLDALPADYYVINIHEKKILQTNDKRVAPGDSCYKVLFNKDKPCESKCDKCLCQQTHTFNARSSFNISSITDGEKKYYRVRSSLINEQTVLVTLDDETEFLKKKEVFEFNAKRLERAEQLVQFGYWEYDLKKRRYTTSLGGQLIYGIKTNRVSFNEVQAFNLEEDKALFKRTFIDMTENKKGFDIKYKIKRLSDGEIRTLRAIGNLNSNETLAFGIVHDITEKEKIQQIRKEHQEYVTLLFENMSSAFAQHRIVTNDEGECVDAIIMDVNPFYEEFFNLRKEDVKNRSIREVFPHVEEEWMERFANVAFTGVPGNFTEYIPWVDKYVEVAVYAPQKGYFVTSINDVSQRVKSEKELKVAKEKAVESDRLKTLFLTNMSHEIRTPLNGILGFSNLLSQPGLTNENRLYYGKIIENSGKRLMTIIDDIIDVSMIQSDQIVINYRAFDVNELLLEIYTTHRKLNDTKLKRIKFNFKSTNVSSLIYSDRAKIYQVLNNLLDNAFKFTQHGKINFGVASITNEQVTFFVKDTGVGIKKEKQQYIFDSFRQAEEGQARAYEGFGLGLAIVSGIVEKLNGTVELNSEYGNGAEFKVILPRNNQKIATERSIENRSQHVAEKQVINRKRVVSFEDEPVSINLLRTIVERKGYDIVNFEDAGEGIEYIRRHSADLVLMDVRLPKMNGYDATRIIKQEFPEIPVVIQTAFAMLEDRKTAFEAGCDDLIAKPYTVDTINQKLNKYLVPDD
ncbi:response regulator [uncultured Draconibacterium sp.]|uniref:hybrid sensor histidine kinase/response regulator n=1 Tax=uncultured Draconibacterium sp. TaxID=1573823 RepID=UPI0029C99892|nr:response regulator [uncultured Draconibacterium sp.]